MDAGFCLNYFEGALRNHGKHEIFNSDQDSKFISDAFTGVLQQEGVVISMDGRGRAFDNILVGRFFGKLFFAVTLFLNNSLLLADPTLSEISYTLRYVHRPRIARTKLARLE